jgi:RNA polymerase sigma-70 factor (ECF subfamily)
MGRDSDIELMLRFGKGDEEAFRTLYMAYRKKIVNYCYRYFGDQRIAEELGQEIFIRVYKAGPRYKPEASFTTWLFKIATHACLNELRRKQHHAESESLDSEDSKVARETADPAKDAHTRMEDRERRKRIGSALRDLPGKQKAALILREYHGFSYQEIADQMDQTESAVKSLIHRGRENLRIALTGEFGKET